MATRRAGCTPVSGRISSFGFLHRLFTAGKIAQIIFTHHTGQIWTGFIVHFMIPIGLDMVVYVVFHMTSLNLTKSKLPARKMPILRKTASSAEKPQMIQ
jgi:hypothetical protein